jgi:hypothetical protein
MVQPWEEGAKGSSMSHFYPCVVIIAGLICLPQVGRGDNGTQAGRENPAEAKGASRPQGAIWTIAFTPDNKTVIAGGADGFIRLWDVASGRFERRIDTRAVVWSVVVARHGKFVASAGEDGTVALWELPSGQLSRRIDTKQGAIRAVAISPDDRTLASGGLDNSVCLWNVGDGALRRRLEGHRERVTCLWSGATAAGGAAQGSCCSFVCSGQQNAACQLLQCQSRRDLGCKHGQAGAGTLAWRGHANLRDFFKRRAEGGGGHRF